MFVSYVEVVELVSILKKYQIRNPNDFKCIWEKSVSRSVKSKDKSVATEKLFTLNNINKINKQLF